MIDTNNRGTIAVAFNGLPYLFLYNKDHELKHIIYLEFPKVSQQNESKPQVVHFSSNQIVSVKPLITDLALTNEGKLYFTDGKRLYGVKINVMKNSYRFQKSWFFTFSDSLKGKKVTRGIIPTTIMVAKDTVYEGNLMSNYIYRFSLKE